MRKLGAQTYRMVPLGGIILILREGSWIDFDRNFQKHTKKKGCWLQKKISSTVTEARRTPFKGSALDFFPFAKEEDLDNSDVKATIVDLISGIAKIPKEVIHEDANLYTLGVDSLMALEIVARVERCYQVEIPEEEITKVKTLRDILCIVSARLCLSVSS